MAYVKQQPFPDVTGFLGCQSLHCPEGVLGYRGPLALLLQQNNKKHNLLDDRNR